MAVRRFSSHCAWLGILLSTICSAPVASADHVQSDPQNAEIESHLRELLKQNNGQATLRSLRSNNTPRRFFIREAHASLDYGLANDAAQAYWEVLHTPQYFTSQKLAEARQRRDDWLPNNREVPAPPLYSLSYSASHQNGRKVGGAFLIVIGAGAIAGGGVAIDWGQKDRCSNPAGWLNCLQRGMGMALGVVLILSGVAGVIGGGFLVSSDSQPRYARAPDVQSKPRLELAPYVTTSEGGLVLLGRF